MPLLTDEEIREYEENGAVCIRGVFNSRWIDTVAEGIKANLAHPSEFSETLREKCGEGAYFDDYFNWRKISQFEDFVRHSPAAELAGTLMKSQSSTFYHEHVLTKEPGTSKKTPWHQDQSYYPIDGFQVCSIWLPIDPCPLEVTLRFVKGSHLWGKWFFPKKFENEMEYLIREPSALNRKYERVPDIEGNPDLYEILAWDLQPGDCVVFHMMTLHGAPGNTSVTNHRRILSTRWLGDDTVMVKRPWVTSPPVDGGLQAGDPPHYSELFPVIWTKPDALT